MSVAWVGVGVAAAGTIAGAASASSAAGAQADAANQANATQQNQYNQTRQDNLPAMQRGNAAGNRLNYLLGLGTDPGTGSLNVAGSASQPFTLNDFIAYNNRIAPAGYSMVGQTADANNQFLQYQSGSYGTDQNAIAQRFGFDPSKIASAQQAVTAAQNDPTYGSLLSNFTTNDLNNDPVYQSGLQFGLDEGEKGLNRQAAASGSLLSGATLKALTKYGNDYASTKANDSYNRFMNNKQSEYNMLAGVAGTGQMATNTVTSAGQNAANNISANQIGVGNARAASAIGSTNALTSGLTNGINSYNQTNLYNSLASKNNSVSANNSYLNQGYNGSLADY